jgi:hypothetical protein
MSGNLNKDQTNVDRARAAWPDTPQWVLLLAAACDLTNQRAAGERIGKSSGYVSRVLSNTYAGNMAEAEKLVRAAWGAETVACPLWGDIPLSSCMAHRRRSAPPRTQVHHLYRSTCPACPNNTDVALHPEESFT